jgi:hypothetical protein
MGDIFDIQSLYAGTPSFGSESTISESNNDVHIVHKRVASSARRTVFLQDPSMKSISDLVQDKFMPEPRAYGRSHHWYPQFDGYFLPEYFQQR